MRSQLVDYEESLRMALEGNLLEFFLMRGDRVIGCERTADGLLLRLWRNGALHIAYCLPTLLAVSSADLAPCTLAKAECSPASACVVTRSWFLPGAVTKARALGIKLICDTREGGEGST